MGTLSSRHIDLSHKLRRLTLQQKREMLANISGKEVTLSLTPDLLAGPSLEELKVLFEAIPENVTCVKISHNHFNKPAYSLNHFDRSHQEALIGALLKSNPKRKLQLYNTHKYLQLAVSISLGILLGTGFIFIYFVPFAFVIFPKLAPIVLISIGVAASAVSLILPFVGAFFDWVSKGHINTDINKIRTKVISQNLTAQRNVIKENLDDKTVPPTLASSKKPKLPRETLLEGTFFKSGKPMPQDLSITPATSSESTGKNYRSIIKFAV